VYHFFSDYSIAVPVVLALVMIAVRLPYERVDDGVEATPIALVAAELRALFLVLLRLV